MRILVVSPYLPHRHVGHGGGVATYQFVRHLARRHPTCLLAFQRSDETADLVADLAGDGTRVETVAYGSDRDRGLARWGTALDRGVVALKSAVSGVPWSALKYDRPAMHRRLRQLIEVHEADLIIVEHVSMAAYARTAREHLKETGRAGHVVLNTHEVGTLSRERRAAATRGARLRRQAEQDAARWREWEFGSLDWADTVTCVTAQDRDLLAERTGRDHLLVMPLGVAEESSPPVSQRRNEPPRLLFVGAYHHLPNRDALELLLGSILPAVRREIPDAELDAVGGDLPPALERLAAATPGATAPGFVEDLEPHYDRAWLYVAPLFSGGGIKIKVLEASARGCAILTTPIGLEGIDLRPEDGEVFCCQDPQRFGAEAARLLADPEGLAEAGRRARRAILERYAWDRIVDDFLAAIEARRT